MATIIYNVTVQPDADIAAVWEAWMLEEHIPALLRTGCFTSARLSKLDAEDAADGDAPTYSAQYSAPDRAHLDRYLADWATQMRQDGIDKFGGRFVAFRSVMKVCGEIRADADGL